MRDEVAAALPTRAFPPAACPAGRRAAAARGRLARPAGVGGAAFLGCVLAITLTSTTAPHRATARGGLESLPALARGPVSAALGDEDPIYRVHGSRALNPAQHLRVRFLRQSVTVTSAGAWIGMTLSGWGRGASTRRPGPGRLRVRGNRVSYAHDSLAEWFANGPLGLEQGFDVTARPAGASGPLTLSLALSGNLHPRLEHDSLILQGHGALLRYGGLAATDARGRPLHSWIELAGSRVLIRVEDRGARYPVRIDPFIQQGELADEHGARGEEFGESLAISGHTIVVGTSHYIAASTNAEQGAAYVFTAPASGWAHARQAAVLTAASGQSEEAFGRSVAVSGKTIVVGAPGREVAHEEDQGAAYVYVKPATGWSNATQTAKLTAQGARNEFFGEAVAVSGNTVVVGAPGRKVGKHATQGAVSVYAMPPSGRGVPTEEAELIASDGNTNDALGIAVAVSGRTIVAGADLHAVASTNQGAAYVFVRPAAGWRDATESAELTDENGDLDELFGRALAISGKTIIVGAPHRAANGDADAGAAYVFAQPASGWAGSLTETATLTAFDPGKGDELGGTLAISGGVIVAGAPNHADGVNPEQGAAYVFVKPTSGWANATQTDELAASDGAAGDRLGRAVAVASKTVIAGAPDHNVAGDLGQGAVYAFLLAPARTSAARRAARARP